MTEEEVVIVEGRVTDQLPGGKFRVVVDQDSLMKALQSTSQSNQDALARILAKEQDEIISVAHISGRIRKHRIRILRGDRITMEMSIYSLNRGRITKRL